MALSRSWLCIRRWSIRELSLFLSSVEYVMRLAVFCAYTSKVRCYLKHSDGCGLAWIVLIPKRRGYARFFEKFANSVVFAAGSNRSRFNHQLTTSMRSCRHVCTGPNTRRKYGKMRGDGQPTFCLRCFVLPV